MTADAEVLIAKIQRGVDEFQVHVLIQLYAIVQVGETSNNRRFPVGQDASPTSLVVRGGKSRPK